MVSNLWGSSLQPFVFSSRKRHSAQQLIMRREIGRLNVTAALKLQDWVIIYQNTTGIEISTGSHWRTLTTPEASNDRNIKNQYNLAKRSAIRYKIWSCNWNCFRYSKRRAIGTHKPETAGARRAHEGSSRMTQGSDTKRIKEQLRQKGSLGATGTCWWWLIHQSAPLCHLSVWRRQNVCSDWVWQTHATYRQAIWGNRSSIVTHREGILNRVATGRVTPVQKTENQATNTHNKLLSKTAPTPDHISKEAKRGDNDKKVNKFMVKRILHHG